MFEKEFKKLARMIIKGGAGSGNHGHNGRPGLVGGSGGGGNIVDWKPSMTEEEANKWAENSKVKDILYHGTSFEAAKKIKEEGFIEGKRDAYGKGIYLTNSYNEGNSYGDKLLKVKVNTDNFKYYPTKEFLNERQKLAEIISKENNIDIYDAQKLATNRIIKSHDIVQLDDTKGGTVFIASNKKVLTVIK